MTFSEWARARVQRLASMGCWSIPEPGAGEAWEAARREALLDAADVAESMTLYTGYDVAKELRKRAAEIGRQS